MATEITEKWVAHDEFRTRYVVAGAGPPVLLLHGSGPGASARSNWQAVLTSSLADSYRLVAPDIAGFGSTEWADEAKSSPASHRLRARQVRSFVAELGLPSLRVVGNSVGGALALALAHCEPERVDRLALLGTLGVQFELTVALDQVWGYEPSPRAMAEVMSTYAYDRSVVTDELVRARYEASVEPGVQRRYADAFAAPRQRHIDEMSLAEVEVGTIEARTLLIHGADDVIVPVDATSRRLVTLLPSADLVVFGRCGHWIHMERRQDLLNYLAAFLS